MPETTIANKQLSTLLGVLGHPMRVQIVLELRSGERDVGSLRDVLGLSHPGVSQHLAILRTHRLVAERREGRRVIYRLADPALAEWLMDGLRFLESAESRLEEVRTALREVTAAWGAPGSEEDAGLPEDAGGARLQEDRPNLAAD